jgi:hypothetical protein
VEIIAWNSADRPTARVWHCSGIAPIMSDIRRPVPLLADESTLRH